jgi:hypothetical protein
VVYGGGSVVVVVNGFEEEVLIDVDNVVARKKDEMEM